MKLTNILLIAFSAALSSGYAIPHGDWKADINKGFDPKKDREWVTFTKDLGDRKITVTKYLGSTPLTGSQYTTRTIVKSDAEGNPQFTQVVTGFADGAGPAQVTAAPKIKNNEWVTYTKNLGDRKITVTKYVGKTSLEGEAYTTKTIVKVDEEGNPHYTELVTGLAEGVSPAQITAAPEPKNEWVTYTKDLGEKKITVTRYVGDKSLKGSLYTTKTILKANAADGKAITELITGLAEGVEMAQVTAAPEKNNEWVTYTKNLGYKKITVTRYVGETPLSGSEYATKTIVKVNEEGEAQYTELVTGYADGFAAAKVTAAPVVENKWVTYTKDLGSRTIVVTRYLGDEPLSGSEYTTRTVVRSSAGQPLYTEIVTGMADPAIATQSGESAAISHIAAEPLILQWVNQWLAWL